MGSFFFCCFIEKLEESEQSLVKHVFEGLLRIQVVCSKCSHQSSNFERILDLSLAIERVDNLIDALELFTKDEKLKRSDAEKLTNCFLGNGAHNTTLEPNVSHHLFAQMPKRDVFTWTAKISLLVKGVRKERAIHEYKSMLQHDVRPNYVTMLCVINAACALKSDDLKRGIHSTAIKFGFELDPFVVTALLGAYSCLGETYNSWKLFGEVANKDLVLWTAMVSVFLNNHLYTEAIDTFRKMRSCGLWPNDVSILSVLPACGNSGSLLLGREIHGFAVKTEFYLETKIQNSLVDFYVKSNRLDTATTVFEMIDGKDIVSWNTIICGCTESKRPEKALVFFSNMRIHGIVPGETILQNVLSAASMIGDVRLGSCLHCLIVKANLSDSISIGTSLFRMYAEFGEVDLSQELFDQFHHRDLVSWSALISVYARGDSPILALEAFRGMQKDGVEANEITLVSLLQACTSMGAEQCGRSIHACLIRHGFSDNSYLTSALIDFYCKMGNLCHGEILFDTVQRKDTVCWSSMIKGYGINGQGEQAIKTFNDMLREGVKPNIVTFVSVLSSCSHSGLVDEGWKLFNSMENHGLSPTMPHYSCMVDMLSRQGHVKEAIELISRMPFEPDAVIWGSVLAGCRETNGDVEAVEIAAEELLRLDSKNSSYYVALSNMYANLGKWEDVERIREFVDCKGLIKMEGHSSI